MDDVLLNKVAIIERCLSRADEEFEKDWRNEFTIQDALILNVEKACQASIDLAAHLIKVNKIGIPQTSREVFDILAQEGMISLELSNNLKKMVGFRNIDVHDYSCPNLDVIESIMHCPIRDLSKFAKIFL